jgi:oxygen-independent coproporphyrinogen-3 oxidase
MKSNHYTCPTVFLGGGTPGIFTDQYAPLLKILAPVLEEGAEISLEANPNNISEASLSAWIDSGFTRLSLGIQSFDESHLKFLNRDHSMFDAEQAIILAKNRFQNLNVDLIYGLPKQTLESWQSDIQRVLDLGVNHLSLYNLTWEPQTVLGRKKNRRIISPLPEEEELSFYSFASDILKQHGYLHEEVSNWSRPGSSCRHNWVYWQGGYYIGIGSGAHGFIPNGTPIGLRYSYPKNDRLMRTMKVDFRGHLEDTLHKSGLNLDLGRTKDSFLLEAIGSSLRTSKGTSIAHLEKICGKKFELHPQLLSLELDGKLSYQNGKLTLDPSLWFMENYWASKVEQSFK